MKNVKKLGLYMMCMGVDLALEHVLLERKRGDVSLETLSSLLQDLETFKKYNEM
jgi:hypothetical protein